MNHPITFTPQEVMSIVLYICGAIMTIAGAAAVIVKIVVAARQPNKTQDERIAECERRLEEHDKLLCNDKKRIDEIVEGNKVTQQALLALLSHAINGNNINELKEAEKALSSYLIRR